MGILELIKGRKQLRNTNSEPFKPIVFEVLEPRLLLSATFGVDDQLTSPILNSYQEQPFLVTAIVVEAEASRADETNDEEFVHPLEIELWDDLDALPEPVIQINLDTGDSERDSVESSNNDFVLGVGVQGDNADNIAVNLFDKIEDFGTEWDLLVSETNVFPSNSTRGSEELSSDRVDFAYDNSFTEQLIETLLAANPPPMLAASDFSEATAEPFSFSLLSGLNNLTLRLTNVDGSEILQLIDDNGAIQTEQALADTSEVVITGLAGEDDTLTIDFSGGIIPVPITFHGGDGGFDSLVITGGSFSGASYSASGPDSGRIILDGTIIDYTGLEPIIDNTIVDERVFTISTTGVDQQIGIRDYTDDGYCIIDSDGLGGFESIAFLNPANSLTVNAGNGNDTITIESLDDEFGAALIINGQDGIDTLVGPNAPNTWAITGTNAGDLTSSLANLTNISVTASFTGVENLTGGSNTDIFTFGENGGVTGTIDDGADTLELTLGGFVTLSGDYSFEKSSKTFMLNNGDSVTADFLTVGASSGTVFAGVGGDTANPIGFNASLDEFALAIITEQGGSNRAWHAVTGTLSSVSFSGIDGLTIEATSFVLNVNTAASDGTVVDFNADGNQAGSPLTVNIGGANFLDIDFDGDAGELLALSGTLELDAFGFVLAYGEFNLFKGTMTINDGHTPAFDAEVLNVDLESGNLFAGVGGAFTHNADGIVTGIDRTDAIGFYVEGVDLDLAILQDTVSPANRYTGLEFTLDQAGLEGINDLTFSVSGQVMVNHAPDGAARLDWATATQNDNEHDKDGRLAAFTMTHDVELWISGDLALDVFGFVVAVGGFDLYKGKLTVNDGSSTGAFKADVLTIELEVAHLFAGTGAGLVESSDGYAGYALNAPSDAVGFKIDVDPDAPVDPSHLSIAIVKDTDPDTTSDATYVGLEFEIVEASLVGVTGLTFKASATVMVNWASDGNRLDWAQAYANDTSDPKRLPEFSEKLTSELEFLISGSMTLDAFGFVLATGSFKLTKGQMTVNDGVTEMSGASLLTVELQQVRVFAGVGASFNADNTINTENAIGFDAGTLTVTMAIVQDSETPANSYTGLELSLTDAQLVGVTDLTFTVSGAVKVNHAPDGVDRLDWATATQNDNEHDQYDLLPAFTMTSSVEYQIDGSMTLDAFGFFYASGGFALEKSSATVTVTDGINSEPDVEVEVLTIGVKVTHAFAGVEGPYWREDTNNNGEIDEGETNEEALGLSLTNVKFALELMKSTSDTNSYYALKATADYGGLEGIDAFELNFSSLTVEVNGGTDTQDMVVDFTTSDLDGDDTTIGFTRVKVGPGTDDYIDLDFSEKLLQASGEMTLVIDDYVFVHGRLAFQKGARRTATLNDGTETTAATQIDVTYLTIGASSVDIFAGNGPYKFEDINGDGNIDEDDNPNAIGLAINNVAFALALLKSTTDTSSYYALSASATLVGLVGISGFTLDVKNLSIQFNGGNDSDVNHPDRVVDFAKSDLDGNGDAKTRIKTGPGAEDYIDIDFSEKLLQASGEMNLVINDYVFVNGTVAFQKGARRTATLNDGTNPTPATEIEVTYLTVGASSVDIFVGNGPYDFTPDADNTEAIGFFIDNASLGLALMKSDMDSYYGLSAFVPTVDLVGLDLVTNILGFDISGVTVQVNWGTDGNRVVDFTQGDLDGDDTTTGFTRIKTGPNAEDYIDLKFTDKMLQAAATVTLKIDDFVFIQGSFAFMYSPERNVKLSDNSTTNVSVLALAANNVNAFVGIGPYDFEPDADNLDALGLVVNNLTFGLAIMQDKTTPNRKYFALKGSADNVGLHGIPMLTLGVEDIILEVNYSNYESPSGKRVVVDFTDDELIVDTGQSSNVVMDFPGELIRASISNGTFELADFVYLSGNFAFEKGPQTYVDVATNIPGDFEIIGELIPEPIREFIGLSTIPNAQVTTMYLGASDVNGFVGLNGPYYLRDENGVLLKDENGELIPNTEAAGLLVDDLDFGFVMMEPTLGAFPGMEGLLPKFYALKASSNKVGLVGLPDIKLEANDVSVSVNFGNTWVKGVESFGRPVVDFASSFPAETEDLDGDGKLDPAGFELKTGSNSVYIDYEGELLIGASVGQAIMELSEFVHLSGSMAFELGPTHTVTVDAGIPSEIRNLINEALDLFNVDEALQDLLDLLGLDLEAGTIEHEVISFTIGGSNINTFVGVDGPYWTDKDSDNAISWVKVEEINDEDVYTTLTADVDQDGYIDVVENADGKQYGDINKNGIVDANETAELNENAVGLVAADIDFGIAVMQSNNPIFDIIRDVIGKVVNVIPGAGQVASIIATAIGEYIRPRYYSMKGTAGQVGFVGLDDIKAEARNISIEMNVATPAWGPFLPSLNFLKSFPDPDGDGPEPAGLRVDTGGVPVYLDFDRKLLRASVQQATLQLSEFLYLSGSFAFEAGPSHSVTVNSGIPPGILDIIKDEASDLQEILELLGFDLDTGTITHGVDSLTIGGSDITAFAGINGPYWTDFDHDNEVSWVKVEQQNGENVYTKLTADNDIDGYIDVVENADGKQYGDINKNGIVDANETAELNEDAIGLMATDLDFGIAVMQSNSPVFGLLALVPGVGPILQIAGEILKPRYFAVKASAYNVGFVGVDEITAEIVNLSVELNVATPWGPLLPSLDFAKSFPGEDLNDNNELDTEDENGNGILDDGEDENSNGQLDTEDVDGDGKLDPVGFEVFTGSDSIYMDFENGLLRASVGQATLRIFDLVAFSGSFAFSAELQRTVKLTDGSSKDVAILTVAAADVYGFVGVNGPYREDTNKNGIISDDLPNPDAVGFAIDNLNLGMVFAVGKELLDPSVYFAMKSSADTIGFVGINDVNTESDGMNIDVNVGLSLNSSAAIDFSKFDGGGLSIGFGATTGAESEPEDDDKSIIAKSEFNDDDLVSKLIDEGVLNNVDNNPDLVRFDDSIENEVQLRERLEQIEDIEIKPILAIWRQTYEPRFLDFAKSILKGHLAAKLSFLGVEFDGSFGFADGENDSTILSVLAHLKISVDELTLYESLASGVLMIGDGGLAGKILLKVEALDPLAGLNIDGLSFSQDTRFDLLINTIGKEADILLPDYFDVLTAFELDDIDYSGGVVLPDMLTTLKSIGDAGDPDYHLFIPKNQEVPVKAVPDEHPEIPGESYILVHADGTLAFPGILLQGTFDFKASESEAMMIMSADFKIGAAGLSLLELKAAGILKVNSDGIAGKIKLRQVGDNLLEGLNIVGLNFDADTKFDLLINTTKKEADILLPEDFDVFDAFGLSETEDYSSGVLLPDKITTLQSFPRPPPEETQLDYHLIVPKNAVLPGESVSEPDPDGEFYILVHAEGNLSLPGATLEGSFNLFADESSALMVMGGRLLVGFESLELLELVAGGAFQLDGTGFAGKLQLSMDTDSESFAELFKDISEGLGFDQDANFDLIVNTTELDKNILLPDTFDALTAFAVSPDDQAKLLEVDENNLTKWIWLDDLTKLQSEFNPTSGKIEYYLIVPKTPEISPDPSQAGEFYILVHAVGKLYFPGFLLDGGFDLFVYQGNAVMDIYADMTMGFEDMTVLQLEAIGILQIDDTGLAGKIHLILTDDNSPLASLIPAEFGDGLGFNADAKFDLVVNTTKQYKDIVFPERFNNLESFGLSPDEQSELDSTGSVVLKDGLTRLKFVFNDANEIEYHLIVNNTPNKEIPPPVDIPTPNDSGELFLVVHAEGDLRMPGVILTGSFDLIAKETHAVMTMGGHLLIGFDNFILLDLVAGGAFYIDDAGLAGKLRLSVDQSLPFAELFEDIGPEFGFKNDVLFDLIINLTKEEKDFTLPESFDALEVFAVDPNDIQNPGDEVLLSDNLTILRLVTNPTSLKDEYHLIVPNTPNPGNAGEYYILVHAVGELSFPGFTLLGGFDLYVDQQRVTMDVHALMTIGFGDLTVMQLEAIGVMQIDWTGLAGKIHLKIISNLSPPSIPGIETLSDVDMPLSSLIPDGLGDDLGFGIDVKFDLIVNTTKQYKDILLPDRFDNLKSFGITDEQEDDLRDVVADDPVSVLLPDGLTRLKSVFVAIGDIEFHLIVNNTPDKEIPPPVEIPTPNDWGLFYLVVHAEGELYLPGATLSGSFDLIADEYIAVMAMDGHLQIGFESAGIELLELRAGGAFLLDGSGLAGKLHLSLEAGQSLPFADLFGDGFGFSGDAQFDLIINLTRYEKDITLPEDFDALGVFSVSESDKQRLLAVNAGNQEESVLLSDNLTTLRAEFDPTPMDLNRIVFHLIVPDTPTIPVAPPQGNGICYVVFMGSGRMDLGGVLHMDGNFMIELSEEKLEFQAEATGTMEYVGSFDVEGILRINTEGLVAHFEVFVDAGFGGSLGLEFSGDALLEINTTADAIQQIGNYTVEQKGLLLEINGQLRIGGLLDLEEGYFYFYISELTKDISPDFELELRVIAKGTLLSIGSFDVDGGMRIDIEGLVAHIEVTLSAGFGSGVGLSFSGNLIVLLDVNTTGSIKYINQERVDPGLLLRITGDLTMLGFNVDGTFTILIQPGVIKFDIDGSISLLGTTLTVDALGTIYTATDPGFVLKASITINGSLFSIPNIFDTTADFEILVNTRKYTPTLGIAPNYLLIDMKNAEVKLLGGVLTFKGSAYIEISGSYFKIVLRTMTLNFFNKGSLTASGFLDSNGNFNLNLYGHIDISINENNGIFGTLSYANISRTNGNLHVSGEASVTARVLGYDIGTVSAVFNYDSTSGRIKTTVTGSKIVIIPRVRVYNVFKRKWVTIIPEVSITPSKTFTIGYLKAPPPPVIAGKVGSVLYLYMGPLASSRSIDRYEKNESFSVTHKGGSASGENVIVYGMGVQQEFTGVTKIIADAGDGNDYVKIYSGVLVPANIYGRDGNDRLYYYGSGKATIYGGTGLDVIRGGSGNDYLYGDNNNDHIYGNAGADHIYGGNGDDWITPGSGNDFIYGGVGDDVYVFSENFGNESLNDVDGINTLNFGGLTSNLSGTSNQTGTVFSSNTNSLNAGVSRIDYFVLGKGNDTFTLSDFNGRTVEVYDSGGNDNYQISIVPENANLYINDTAGNADTLTVNLDSAGSHIELNQYQLVNGSNSVNFDEGIDSQIIIDSASATTLINIDNGGVSLLDGRHFKIECSDLVLNSELTTDSGDITVNATGVVDLNADVSSDTGNIEINSSSMSQNSNVSTGVGGNVTVTASSGAIAMASGTTTTTVSGNITYNASTNVNLSVLNSTSGGSLSVTATTGTISDNLTGESNTDLNMITSGMVNLTAKSGIGSVGEDIDTGIGTVTANNTGVGDIYLQESNGLIINSVFTLDGDINIDVNAGALTVSGTVEALGSDIMLNVDSGPIELNAPVTSNGGYIMVSGDSVDQNANIITGGVGTVTVTADNGAITMDSGTMTTTISGNITYSATADVSLSILTSTSEIVFVTAGFGTPETGSILDNNNSETVNIRGNSVLLLAGLSIGTSINALETQVNNIEANAGIGGIWIVNTGGLIIGGISDTIGLQADGPIIVTAFSPLTVQENILSAGDIILTATDSAGLGDDLVLTDAVSIVSTGGSVTLRAGDNLLITAYNVVKATGDVIIHGDYGDADTGIGSTIDLRGTILGTSALIMGNNDNDIISLTNVNAVTPTTIQTFDGDDLIHVGSNATPTSNLGGNVNSISALLNVYGGSGIDRLKVDDSGDDEPNSGTLTATTITGLGMQDGITYWMLEHLHIGLGSGGNDFKIDSTHAGTTTITFGEGDDTINVRTTGGVLNIDAEGGDDIIYVGSLAPGIGGTLNGIGGLLTVEGGSGFDILNVDDTGDTIPNTGAMTDETLTDLGMVDGIAYGTMENIEVSLGSVNDTLTVNSTMKGDDGFHRVTMVNTGAGDDMVNVSLQVETDGFFALNTEAGDDHVDASISTLPLAIFGGEDDDTILGGEGDDIIVGDRGRIDYRDGAGTLITRFGIDLTERNVIAPGADDTSPLDVPLRQTDGLSRSPSLVVTRDPTRGGTDLIEGSGGDDIILGGTASDMIYASNGVDLIFGDQGEVLSSGGNNQVVTYYDETPPWYNGYTYTATETQNDSAGAGDVIYGEAGGDYILGQQGTDLIWGGDDDDDIYGGHNVAGGYDTGDFIDGGTGNDVIAGDNASIHRTGAAVSPRFRALEGTMIYGEDPVVNDGLPLVTDDAQENPTGAHVRTIVLFDHSTDTATGTFGDDTIAGGADEDTIFGQLGDDTLHGDGQLVETQPYELMSLTDPISGSNIGGDDYIEGNGGEDTIYGGLGQDDIIGGSSSLLSLGTPDLRPDGSDTIFGGNGDMTARNDPGDESSDGHALDADVIAGDNANILRLVGVNGEVGVGETGIATFDGFLAFNYDIYSSILRIIPRAVELLDYTPGGLDWNPVAENDIGAADEIHGESGDDVIYGMLGGDVLFGEGQDDDITGGTGHDFISAGTGTDGVIGDDGRIYTSRNSNVPVGETGYSEPLYGILPVQVDRGSDIKVISTPGNIQYAQINELGELKKTVNLTPFGLHDGDFSEPRDADFDPNLTEADDIIFGGWGDDFLHGGVGDDAISGAEALPEYYAQPFDSDNPGTFNPGNILGYSQGTVQTGDNGKILLGRAEEFAAYNEYDPRSRILVAKNENGIWEFATDGSRQEFVLNYNTQGEGEFIRSFIDAEGNTMEIWSDGDDTIFGDLGNDWLVGGTGRDHLWGGYGNDLLNADDDLDTGDVPDGPEPSYEDLAYGGAGRDVLIANTGGDRLIDWAGEFNSYIVPFAPFGLFTISRSLQPQMKEFLYDLSEADGADPTRSNDTGKSEKRNGEPEGEIGLVQQQDDDWHDQTGAPKDIQPGNIPGGKRDVIGSATFNTGIPDGYAADSGIWVVDSGRLEVSPEVLGGDAVSVMHIQDPLPSYFEVQATINAGKPTAGYKSNAFLIFDYQSPTDYKYAGVNISNDKLEMGYRDATGWHELEQTNAKLKPDTAYHLLLALNGTTATLVVNGSEVFTHVFEARLEDSYAFGLNAGMVGLGAYNSIARIDDVKVQVLPPEITFQATDEFDPEVADLFAAESIGSWVVTDGRYVGMPEIGMDFAASTMDLLVASASFLEIETVLQTDAIAGVIFDCYSPTDFKFAAISVQDNQVLIGHHTKHGWFIDATEEQVLDAGMDYRLRVSLKGTTVSVAIAEAGDTIGDLALLGYSFNAVVVDGAFGLLSKDGSGSFESASVKTNDPVFTTYNGSADAFEAKLTDTSQSFTIAPFTGNQVVISTQADGAYSVYACDLDGDGDNDVLLASVFDDKITWYENRLNEPTADFGSQQVISTQADGAASVYACDLDGDGDNDVLSASAYDDKIAWYENLGGGTFGTQKVIATDVDYTVSVYACDLDCDGDNDVLSTSRYNDRIAWYANDGSGNFGDKQSISTDAEGAMSVYACDLDGDGDNDVLSASWFDDKIAWYENRLNELTADFGSQQVISTQADGTYSLYACDLDGDGDNDVLSASYIDDKVAWYENSGGGTFGSQQVISTQADGVFSVYACDLDGDGDNDVLSASILDDKIAWYENLISAGVGAPEIDVERNGTDDVHTHSFGTLDPAQSISQEFTVRNEGDADLVVTQAAGLVSPFSISPLNSSGSTDDWVIPASGI